jgi:transposase
MPPRKSPTPETCPLCGADVPARAKACPECGADHATGWSDQARYDSLDLPDQEFDYDEFVQREFAGRAMKRRTPAWILWTGFGLLLIAVLFGFLR